MRRTALLFYFIAVLIHSLNVSAQTNKQQSEALEGVGIEERLGELIPLDATFATSTGDSVQLGDLLEEGKPVILNPLYYECPMLCGLVIDGVLDVAEELAWSPGEDYLIFSISIDPTEDHTVAARHKEEYLSKLKHAQAEDGWYFLTGKQNQIDRVVGGSGFQYKELENTGEFAHSAAIIMLAPDGKITRYLYGIKYDEFNVRNALYESADGQIGSTAEKLLMYCYQYDPDSNSYVPFAMNIMKLGGLATLIILGIFMGLLWLRDKQKATSNINIQ